MGASILLASAASAVGFASMVSQNRALEQQGGAAARAANREIAELQRQREEENLIAQEKKSERVRAADRAFATSIVTLGDAGGGGTVNESQFAATVGFTEGLDLARLEGNRRRKVESLRAAQVSTKANALNIIKGNRAQMRGNLLSFLGNSLATFASASTPGAGGAAKPVASAPRLKGANYFVGT